jgi:pre-mRNA-processing factor 6
VDAFRKCEADPLVICTVARLYWADWRIEKAHRWFEHAVSAGLDFGVGGSNSSANIG